MRITAHMIADRLGDRLVEARIPDGHAIAYDSALILLSEENQVMPEQAYIVDSLRIGTLTGLDETQLLISPLPGPDSLPGPVILCRGTIHEINAAVLAVFKTYASLEDELKEALLGDWDLNQMLAPLVRFFANPVQVYAPIFKAVASVRPVFDKNGAVSGTVNYEQVISADIVHGMLRSSELQQDIKSGLAHYRRYPVFDYGCFQVNLLSQDKLIGRLVVIEENSSFSPSVSDTLNIVSKYIRYLMIHRQRPVNASLFTVDYAISEILGGRITDRRVIKSLMSMIAWPAGEPISILYFSLAAQDMPAVDLPTQDLASYHIQALGDLLPHAIILPIDDGIVALCRTKLLTPPVFEDLLEPYLATAGIYAGLGETFFDFETAKTSYQQARTAVQLGAGSKATGHVFSYQDNAVDHLVKVVIDAGYGATFIHPAIDRVVAHDQKNQTELLMTLRTYLASQCNQVAAAQKLHIHRNSMKYRLQQLSEVMGLDLRKTSQHLRLLLSILIRDRL